MNDVHIPNGPFATKSPLILASGSPRRKLLLEEAGLVFRICTSSLEEPQPEKSEAPKAYAERMALLKALDVADKHSNSTVLAADTIVVAGKKVLGKPANEAEALTMLQMLAGQSHQVITGCCVIPPSPNSPVVFSTQTTVTMRDSTEDELAAYIATREPMDKAGAYAIQGVGGFMVESITGSYSNVVGLPLVEMIDVLLEYEVIIPATKAPAKAKARKKHDCNK